MAYGILVLRPGTEHTPLVLEAWSLNHWNARQVAPSLTSIYAKLVSAPGEGNGNPLQYSCLENPMDGEAW